MSSETMEVEMDGVIAVLATTTLRWKLICFCLFDYLCARSPCFPHAGVGFCRRVFEFEKWSRRHGM
jgi:hypothetical protein